MIKILFVCHGNICRSPMAEFIMKKLVKDAGASGLFEIDSAATSAEELGNDIYPPARRKLSAEGIPFSHRSARQMCKGDYSYYDYIVAMEHYNLRNMIRFCGSDPDKKVSLLLDYTSRPGDVADPWFSGNFDVAYTDIMEGCTGLLSHIFEKQM